MRLDKITVRTIQKFVSDLTAENKYNCKGKVIGKLAPKTITHHIAFVSSIFDYAVSVYSLEEVQQMLKLFENESEANLKYVIFFTLAVFTGLRRSELLGLEWKDFDFEVGMIHVIRTSEWTKEKGIYTDTPKTKSSNRMLKLPSGLVAQLLRFKKWQDEYKDKIGSKWIENDRLFTKWNGEPMGMRSPYKFYEKFCQRTGMRFVNIHSFRHFNATAMILNGVDVKTVQACLGHNDATTTLNIYAHSFQEAQVRAMESVADCIYGDLTDNKTD